MRRGRFSATASTAILRKWGPHHCEALIAVSTVVWSKVTKMVSKKQQLCNPSCYEMEFVFVCVLLVIFVCCCCFVFVCLLGGIVCGFFLFFLGGGGGVGIVWVFGGDCLGFGGGGLFGFFDCFWGGLFVWFFFFGGGGGGGIVWVFCLFLLLFVGFSCWFLFLFIWYQSSLFREQLSQSSCC